ADDDEEDDEEDDPAEEDDEREINLQLRNLLKQQAEVLKGMHEPEIAPPPKVKKRPFRFFGLPAADEEEHALQTV
ncbi:MAG: hypothetical protein ACR2P3_05095, partial [Geminicoccaceae bacterium]